MSMSYYQITADIDNVVDDDDNDPNWFLTSTFTSQPTFTSTQVDSKSSVRSEVMSTTMSTTPTTVESTSIQNSFEQKVVLRRKRNNPSNKVSAKTDSSTKSEQNRTSYYRLSRLMEGVANYVSARTVHEEDGSFSSTPPKSCNSKTSYSINNSLNTTNNGLSSQEQEINDEISKIFESIESIPVTEVVIRRSRVSRDENESSSEAGFISRRKQTVSTYFSDWAKWLTNSDTKIGLIETDAKSLNSLSGTQCGHSRRSSDTSQISVTSGSSNHDNTIKAEETSEEDLWLLWGKIINEWDVWSKKRTTQIRELVRRGIPHHFRGIAWQLLCGAHESKDKPKYAEYIKTQSACEKVIRRDIARTYPEHEFFKQKDGFGQEALFHVMKAYSIHDREVGYCQGSAFIVGLLLMQMPEEESFAVLVKIMQDYRMREMFKPSMAELGLCMYQLDMLVQEHIPDLYGHFQSQSIHTNLYASSWFLTLYTTALPISLACRVMDCFLVEGLEVIFRLALSLLLLGKHELLVQDIEGVIRYFQKDMPAKFEADPESVISLAFSLKINQKKMKKMEREYMTMKTKEKEDEIELRRLRTENRLLRQRVDLLEQESSDLADRLIQGQVTRAELEEQSFATKRELAAIKQHDLDTNQQLEEAKDKIRKMSQIVEQNNANLSDVDKASKVEQLKQKEDMIHCLQDELIKVRLREAENEDAIRKLSEKISELEEENKKLHESVPENHVASMQEELAAVKLREAEANLALKDLKAKVAELNGMWQKHLRRNEAAKLEGGEIAPSTPKKLFGSLLEGKSEAARLEEELMTARLTEVEGQAELKEQRLKVMDLETHNQVIANQLKRQNEELSKLRESLDAKNLSECKLHMQVREAQRKYADLETRMKEDLMMTRIREAENAQMVAELTQKISALEYKNQEKMTEGEMATTMNQSDKVRELQDKIAHLRAQVTKLSLINAKLSKSLSHQNLSSGLTDCDSETSTPSHTPVQAMSPAQSSLKLNLSTSP